MPSINDVFNQLVAVNATLGQIHADGIAETNATTQVKASVDNLDNDVKAGFAATVQALNTIALIDIEAVKLLFHLTQQTDTMICALEHISQNTCGILTQVTIQTQLQTRIRDDEDALRDIAEAAYPQAVVGREKLAALRAEVERCCPPAVTPPACTYQPCLQPKPVGMPDLPRVDDHQPPPIK
jgi:hypothetical protein